MVLFNFLYWVHRIFQYGMIEQVIDYNYAVEKKDGFHLWD
jgi:hypothetical protein